MFLVAGIKEEVQACLKSLYVEGDANGVELGLIVLNVWSVRESNLRIMNNHIIPAVLAGIDPEKTPAFSLSVATLPSVAPHEYLKQFFNQIHSCFKKNMVAFLPCVDKLWSFMDARAKDIF